MIEKFCAPVPKIVLIYLFGFMTYTNRRLRALAKRLNKNFITPSKIIRSVKICNHREGICPCLACRIYVKFIFKYLDFFKFDHDT